MEDKVFVREGDRCWFVPVKNLRLLESEGNYTRLYFDDQKPQLFRSLTAMEERLDPKGFLPRQPQAGDQPRLGRGHRALV
jgi:two-component system LytT family response regulator